VWQGQDLPMIYSGSEILPTLGDVANLTVNAVMVMTQQGSAIALQDI